MVEEDNHHCDPIDIATSSNCHSDSSEVIHKQNVNRCTEIKHVLNIIDTLTNYHDNKFVESFFTTISWVVLFPSQHMPSMLSP